MRFSEITSKKEVFMFKKLLCAGLLFAPAFVSAGLWEDLHQNEEMAARVAQLSEEDKTKLKAFCDMRDTWQQNSAQDLLARAGEHSEGVALLQSVTNASEIRVVCDLVCLPQQNEVAQDDYPKAPEAEQQAPA
jgi:hypothetical protein